MLIYNSRLRKHPRKLKLQWIGPCIITEEIALDTFSLQNLDGTQYPSNVNAANLKPYFGVMHEETQEIRENSKD